MRGAAGDQIVADSARTVRPAPPYFIVTQLVKTIEWNPRPGQQAGRARIIDDFQ
jgi:hypothetical protein